MIENHFKKLKANQYDLVIVIIGDEDFLYNSVKQVAELQVGLMTQCLKGKTAFNFDPSTANNVLMKINAKLNGTNHTLKTLGRPRIMNTPTMIMGADVTHPSPDSKDIPSVAAVTASHDPKAFKYNICWRLQEPREEIIVDLKNIVVEQLRYFKKITYTQPQKIIFYRDGVSEGQFKYVLNKEVQAIRQACMMLNQNYKPCITFLVVQKRHHTRFFPVQKQQDRNNNVPPGTCVDTVITHPTRQEFFLVSHTSFQGVAKPTKYVTLWDDSDFTDDEIEELTFFLCHLFARCTKSVSYPTPTYYAHLAAARAKVYCENKRLNMQKLNMEQEKLQILECIRKEMPMFFV